MKRRLLMMAGWLVASYATAQITTTVTAPTSPTNNTSLAFSVVFGQPMEGFDNPATDLTIGGTATGTLVGVISGGPTNYTVTITGMTGSGTVTLQIPAGVADENGAGTTLNAVSNLASVTFDNVSPSVTINQKAGQVDPTNVSPVLFTAVFSEPISTSSFTLGDVASGFGSVASITQVAPMNGTTFEISITATGSGTVQPTIAAGLVTDLAGNSNLISTSTDNSVVFDSTPPTVTVNQEGAQADPTSTSPVLFTAVFSKPINAITFSNGDVTVGGTATGTAATVTQVAPNNGTTFQISVSVMGGGTVIVSLASGVVSDPLGNLSAASSSTDNSVTFVTIPILSSPTVSGINDVIATLGGTVVSNGGSPITDHGTEWGLSAGGTGANSSSAGGSIAGAFTQPRTGLPAGTQIFYRAYATNSVGTGFTPVASFFTFSTVPGSENPNFSATVNSSSQITLNFNPYTGISNADGYIILRRVDNDPVIAHVQDGIGPTALNTSPSVRIATITTTTTVFVDSGLTPGTDYRYALVPFNWNGANPETYNYLTGGGPDFGGNYLESGTTYSNSSTIVLNGGTTSDIDYAGSQTASGLNNGNSVSLATFQIRDGGASNNDADNVGTTLTSLTISLANSQFVRTVALFDGGSNLREVTVPTGPGPASIIFNTLSVSANDNATNDFVIRATFRDMVTDNEPITVTITNAVASGAGSGFINGTAGTGATTGTATNRIEVTATKAVFLSNPPPTDVNTNFGLTVRALDGLNNLDLDNVANVTLSISGGNPSAVLSFVAPDASLTKALSSGVASWTALRINLAGTYTITGNHATFSGGNDATGSVTINSTGVNITHAAPLALCLQSASDNRPGSFTTLGNIVIEESDPSDFASGANQTFSIGLPPNFIFNTSLTPTPIVLGSNISVSSPVSYVGNSIVRVTYSVSGTAGTLDRITIGGLAVKYVGTAPVAAANITRVGGTAIQAGNSEVDNNPHGSLSGTQGPTPVDFVNTNGGSVQPNETRFSIFSPAIILQGKRVSDNADLSGVFSGTGVLLDNDGKYKFNPALLAVGNYDITFTYEDPAAPFCRNSRTKTFQVFSSSIAGLNADYCIDGASSTMTANMPSSLCDNNPDPLIINLVTQYVFLDFVYWNGSSYQPIPAPNNQFNPADPIHTNSINVYGGAYIGFRVTDVCNSSTLIWSVEFARIFQKPVIDFNATLPSTVCAYDPSITLIGNPALQNNSFDQFFSSQVGSPTTPVAGVTGNFASGYTFNPATAIGASTTPVTVQINYRYRNEATTCTNQFFRTITVNPKPPLVPVGNISGRSVAGDLDPNFCLSENINAFNVFTASPILGTSYRWFADDPPTVQLNLGNAFTPSGLTSVGTTSFFVTQSRLGCQSDARELTVTIDQPAVVDAGNDATICSGNDLTLSSLSSSLAGAALAAGSNWTVVGGITGQFLDASDNPITPSGGFVTFTSAVKYRPSASDASAGFVRLALVSNDPVGPCNSVTDEVRITINSVAQVNAGNDITVCSGQAISLSSVIGGAATSITWSDGGRGGVFSPNATSASVSYTPSSADLANGVPTGFSITVQTNDPPGPCPSASDNLILSINQAPTVTAGFDRFVCQGAIFPLGNGTPSIGGSATSALWTVDSGVPGVFAGNTGVANSFQVATFASSTFGQTRLRLTTNDPDGSGPCVAVSDDMILTTNQAAVINAGVDKTYCATEVISLSGTTGGSTSSVTWSRFTGTGGTIVSPAATSTNFNPSTNDRLGALITFRISSNDPDGTDPITGPCPIVTDDVDITINRAAEVDAGADRFVCQNNTITLSQTNPIVQGSASSATWSVDSGISGTLTGNTGTGTSYLNTVFAPANPGLTTLRLTTNDPDGAGPCLAVSDVVNVTTNLAAVVSAGPDNVFCAGNTVALAGSTGGSTSTVAWSRVTGSGGSFGNTNAPITTYNPSTPELINGAAITFRLTTNDPDGTDPITGPCLPAEDDVTITINQRPEVNAGPDQTLCADEPVNLSATLIGAATSGNWSGGAGTFSTAGSVTTGYNLSTSEQVGDLTVTVLFTTNDSDGAGPCVPGTDQVLINVKPVPNSPAISNPGEYCVGDIILPLEAVGAPNSTIRWYRDAAISNLAGTGNSFSTGVTNTVASQTTFYATQTVNGCESNVPAAFEDIIINPLPVTQFTESDFCLDPAGNGVDFVSTSTVPNGTVVKWGWSFGDLDRLDVDAGAIPAGTHQGATTGNFNAPSHRYRTFGSYAVVLTTESDKGCTSSASKNITIEPIPEPNFQFGNQCDGDNTQFEYIGTFTSFIGGQGGYVWDFGDAGATSSVAQPSHRFTRAGNYTVRLTVSTNLGCTASRTKVVSVLPLVSVTNGNPYTQSFETNGHGWFSEGFTPRNPATPDQYFNSWQVATANFPEISNASDGTRVWITRDNTLQSYRNDERSVLNSPCFVIGNSRPVVSFDYWNSTDERRDGAYLEVSTDNGITWTRLGNQNQGLNWYNTDAITGLAQVVGKEQTGPIGQSVGQIGWSGKTKTITQPVGWTNARIALDTYGGRRIRLRFVFGSNPDQPSTGTFDGFAVDNFSVDSRNRLVLVENFTNAAATGTSVNNVNFRTFQETAANEIVKVQYHTSFPGADPINAQSGIDVNARAAFYGITAAPRGYVDGLSREPFTFVSPAWAVSAYNTQSLATAQIDIAVTPTRDGNNLNVSVSVRAIKQSIPGNRYILFVGVLEGSVGAERFVLRKFLPSAAGTPLPALAVGGADFTSNFSWPIDSRNFAATTPAGLNLSVIAFVQAAQPDPNSQIREVLQAAINTTPVPAFDSFTTGLEGLPDDAIATYPNPAKDVLHVELPFDAATPVEVALVDQLGKRAQIGSIAKGTRSTSLSVSGLAAGVYILQLGSAGQSVRKKIVITQ